MSDAVDRGFTVTEMAPMGQPIDSSRETTAAFVGRALRGPLNEPLLIHSFGEFCRRFGDIWSRSSLGPAAQQFFEHGGRNLYVVRVANNSRGAMICLPAAGSALVLRAIEPGSTECIRAAVDYDGIAEDDVELFNLTLQRVDPQTGLVADQEMYRHASFLQEKGNFIADLLLTSSLAHCELPLPTHRPEATIGRDTPYDSTYVQHAQDGSDGHELSDYDIVGSRKSETGLFALQKVEQFDILYLPPLGRGHDVGPTSVLAAERYCRERGSMLVVDPHSGWDTPDDAVKGVRRLGYASPNMLGYFPRMQDRRDLVAPARAVGGAVAGLLCKLDRSRGVWQSLDQHGLGLSRDLVPAVEIDDEGLQVLTRAGISSFASRPAGSARLVSSVTMGRGSESHREFASLSAHRLCLRIVSEVRQATRWAVFEPPEEKLADRIRSQVADYLSSLVDIGALQIDRFFVHCDAGLCRRTESLDHGVTILIAFRPVGCGQPVSVTLHQTVAGCRVARTVFGPADTQ